MAAWFSDKDNADTVQSARTVRIPYHARKGAHLDIG